MSTAVPMSHADPRADINTTPLVDVMLVLLIIFMITAPLLSHRVDFRLPQPVPGPPKDPPIELRLQSQDGLILASWDGEPVSSLQLQARLQSAAASDEAVALVVRADDAVPYPSVTELLALTRQAGVSAVVVDPG